MGNLRDQLKKAKILSKKDAKRLAHEERLNRKSTGREELEQQDSDRRAKLEQLQAATRVHDRERQAELEAVRLVRDERAACAELLRTQVQVPERGGTIRWHFETMEGYLPYLMLKAPALTQLQGGAMCVVRRGRVRFPCLWDFGYGSGAASHGARAEKSGLGGARSPSESCRALTGSPESDLCDTIEVLRLRSRYLPCRLLAAMKSLCFLALALLGTLTAQVPNTCDVKRNNGPYFYVSNETHTPGTGRAYNAQMYQPPGYWSTSIGDAGVVAGSLSWRWIPRQINLRLETRQVSGFYVFLRPSAATTAFPFTGYIPTWLMYPAALRADGGFAPDVLSAPLHIVPQVSFVFPTSDAYRARSVFSVAVPVDAEDVCVAYIWAGGEHRMLPNSQGFIGTTDENPWPVVTWGAETAASGMVLGSPPPGLYSTPWGSYYEDAPVLNVESDYAHQRVYPPTLPLHSGFNDAAGLSDLSTSAVEIGWNVEAGLSNAFGSAAPLFNLAAAVPTVATSVLGLTIEVDLANPMIASLSAIGYPTALDSNGELDGHRELFPIVGPSLLGGFIGVEFVILDQHGVFAGSTQSHWIEIR